MARRCSCRLERAVDDQLHADRGRKVVDRIRTFDLALHDVQVEDGALDKSELRILEKVADVRIAPSRKVVEGGDLVAVADQVIDEVRADEPRPAGDENSHQTGLGFSAGAARRLL